MVGIGEKKEMERDVSTVSQNPQIMRLRTVQTARIDGKSFWITTRCFTWAMCATRANQQPGDEQARDETRYSKSDT